MATPQDVVPRRCARPNTTPPLAETMPPCHIPTMSFHDTAVRGRNPLPPLAETMPEWPHHDVCRTSRCAAERQPPSEDNPLMDISPNDVVPRAARGRTPLPPLAETMPPCHPRDVVPRMLRAAEHHSPLAETMPEWPIPHDVVSRRCARPNANPPVVKIILDGHIPTMSSHDAARSRTPLPPLAETMPEWPHLRCCSARRCARPNTTPPNGGDYASMPHPHDVVPTRCARPNSHLTSAASAHLTGAPG